MPAYVLTINGGSSSIKFSLFAPAANQRLLAGNIERIGIDGTTLRATFADGAPAEQIAIAAPGQAPTDHAAAARRLVEWLDRHGHLAHVAALSHRFVHGGARLIDSQRVTDAVLAELKQLIPIDRAHLPGEIALVETLQERLPNVPQVACFDTAFHRHMPRVAQLMPLPRRFEAEGMRRYGFHGLSYTYLMSALARLAGAEAANGRVILAHLGAGASLAAVRGGKSIDTSMAFTPTAGLVMGTRSGDLDPGALVYLMRAHSLNADQLDDLVNRQSGMKGVSETSSDMRDLLAHEATDPRAAEAVELFCYQTKKWLGAYAAVLGGVDTLVFSGGIGEHAAPVRERICTGLDHLGIRLDVARNNSAHSDAGADVISAADSRCCVRVIPTDEESVLASEAIRVLPGIDWN